MPQTALLAGLLFGSDASFLDAAHGDDWAASAAAEIAREKWDSDVPAGDREAAAAFVADGFEGLYSFQE